MKKKWAGMGKGKGVLDSRQTNGGQVARTKDWGFGTWLWVRFLTSVL